MELPGIESQSQRAGTNNTPVSRRVRLGVELRSQRSKGQRGGWRKRNGRKGLHEEAYRLGRQEAWQANCGL